MARGNRYKFYAPHADDTATNCKCCDHPDCHDEGLYRAPKSRERLNDYYWFCLKHVEEYNKSWDYFAGMGSAQIQWEYESDVSWNRASLVSGDGHGAASRLRDYVMLEFYEFSGRKKNNSRQDDSACAKALRLFELSHPVDFTTIRMRYRELVKRHHPDANLGCCQSENCMKEITHAYRVLKLVYGKPDRSRFGE